MTSPTATTNTRDAEEFLWSVLDLDAVGERMEQGSAPGSEVPQMGTGHTDNACYQCTNSASTAGCGTCGM